MNKIFIALIVVLRIIDRIEAKPKISANTAVLNEFDSEKILYELDPDLTIYPASMTKIMTTIIAFDLLKQNKLSLDDKFIVSEKAWRLSQSGYSSMFIMINDEVSVEDLLKGIIIASGNDACVALAEGIAGTEENFVDIMNEKAAEIGMTDTNFANSSGINNTENYSTVKDIAIMSKYLIQNYPEYYPLYAETEFTWDRTGGDPITQSNRNNLLYKKIGVDGIKTGYLAVEKYSLASTMKKDTRRLISVISGLETKALRINQSIKLLNWGFRNTDTYLISKKNETVFEINSWLSKNKTIVGMTKEDLYVTLSKKDSRNLKVTIDYDGPIKAPIEKGAKIAQINVSLKDEVIKSLPIYSLNQVEKVNFLKSLFTSINYLIWGDV